MNSDFQNLCIFVDSHSSNLYLIVMLCAQRAGWRTMLVVPELKKEVQLLWESRDTRKVLINFCKNKKDRISLCIKNLSNAI